MSGSKSLTLFQGNTQVHARFRYKILKTAVRRAIDVNFQTKKDIVIWDLERGQELARITSQYNRICVNTQYPRVFNSRWAS